MVFIVGNGVLAINAGAAVFADRCLADEKGLTIIALAVLAPVAALVVYILCPASSSSAASAAD